MADVQVVNDKSKVIGNSRNVTVNDKPETRKRGSVSAKFRQPPPLVDIDLGWGHFQAVSIEEAETLVIQMIHSIALAKKNTSLKVAAVVQAFKEMVNDTQ